MIIQIIIIAAGIYVLIREKIGVDNKRELHRPKSIYVGIALVLIGILASYIGMVIALVLLVLLVIISYFLADKKETAPTSNQPKQSQ